MALTVLVAPRVIQAGTFGPSPAQTIASSPSPRTLTIQFTSTDWTTSEAGLVVDYVLEVSTNNGASWVVGDAASFVGGAVNARTGQLPSSSIPLPTNVEIQIRGTLTLNKKANSLGFSYDIF